MKKISILILALLLLFTFAASAATSQKNGISITTGLPTDQKDARVMICQMDNEPGARPQRGIGSADIVYETEIYDGGYTRYTAVFNDVIPEQVEAVRSARIVNVDIYSEYGGAFVHFADLMRAACIEQDAFGRGGFTGVDVSHDADVAYFV